MRLVHYCFELFSGPAWTEHPRQSVLMMFLCGGPIVSSLPRLQVPIVSAYTVADADFRHSACACFFASESAAEKLPETGLARVSSVMQSYTGWQGQVGNAGKIAGILRKQTLSESTDVIGKQNIWVLGKQTVFQHCWSSLKLEALHSLYSLAQSDRIFTRHCCSSGFVTPANPIPLILIFRFIYLRKGGKSVPTRFGKLASVFLDIGYWHGSCPAGFAQAGPPAPLLLAGSDVEGQYLPTNFVQPFENVLTLSQLVATQHHCCWLLEDCAVGTEPFSRWWFWGELDRGLVPRALQQAEQCRLLCLVCSYRGTMMDTEIAYCS